MFCTKCGEQNPKDGQFCWKCGHHLFVSQPQREQSASSSAATATAPAFEQSKKATAVRFSWISAYGWLYTLAGVVGAFAAFYQKTIGITAGMFFQGILFVATGTAILDRRVRLATNLLWITVLLSGVGVALRGLVPLEILLWILNLAFAVCYTATAPKYSERSANRWIILVIVAGCVTALVLVTFFGRAGDEHVTAHRTQDAAGDLKARLDPESLHAIRSADLATLEPAKLLADCGLPLRDVKGTLETKGLGVLPSRTLSYHAVDGSTLTFSFISLDDGISWLLGSASDDMGRRYSYTAPNDVSRIWGSLPCLRE